MLRSKIQSKIVGYLKNSGICNEVRAINTIFLEVKSGKDYDEHASLDTFVNTADYNISMAYVFSNNRDVAVRGKMVYMPVYYSMFFVPSTEPEEMMI